MAEQNRKCKMISLRLSPQEYQTLQRLYPSFGARSLSEFARLAMHRIIDEPATASRASHSKLLELDQRVSLLEERSGLLSKREKELSQPDTTRN